MLHSGSRALDKWENGLLRFFVWALLEAAGVAGFGVCWNLIMALSISELVNRQKGIHMTCTYLHAFIHRHTHIHADICTYIYVYLM